MQFTKIRLSGRTDIDLPFFGLHPSYTYILKAGDGLGPPEIDVSIAPTRYQGGSYQGRRPQNREIVLRVGLNPNYSVGQTAASIRTTLYGLLTPGPSDEIGVKFMNGPTVMSMTKGYIKKLEIVPFSKDPEVQITIACDQPYLHDEVAKTVLPTVQTEFTVDNTGTVTTGFYMELIFNAAASRWSLFNVAPNTDPRMQLNYDFLIGDKLMIDTRAGRRMIKCDRAGVLTNLVGRLSTYSTWFQLHPDVNTFWADPVTFDWGKIVYFPTYWGI